MSQVNGQHAIPLRSFGFILLFLPSRKNKMNRWPFVSMKLQQVLTEDAVSNYLLTELIPIFWTILYFFYSHMPDWCWVSPLLSSLPPREGAELFSWCLRKIFRTWGRRMSDWNYRSIATGGHCFITNYVAEIKPIFFMQPQIKIWQNGFNFWK